MYLEFTCPTCMTQLTINADDSEGPRVCPGCNSELEILVDDRQEESENAEEQLELPERHLPQSDMIPPDVDVTDLEFGPSGVPDKSTEGTTEAEALQEFLRTLDNRYDPAEVAASLAQYSSPDPQLPITTGEAIPGYFVVAVVDVVEGSAVMAQNAGVDFATNLQSFFGGEVSGYTKLLQATRIKARQRMVATAARLGAHAIIGVRYSTSSIAPGMSELMAYGTAVMLASPEADEDAT